MWRPSHFVVLLVLMIGASYAFGDTIYVGATDARDLPPPQAVMNFHAIDTFRVQTDSDWMTSHGITTANANRQSSVLLTPIRFSERDSYKGKKNKDRKTAAVSVPEPSGIQLLGIGFIGLAFAVRKFRI